MMQTTAPRMKVSAEADSRGMLASSGCFYAALNSDTGKLESVAVTSDDVDGKGKPNSRV